MSVKGIVFDYGGVLARWPRLSDFMPVAGEIGFTWEMYKEGFARYRRAYDGGKLTCREMYRRILKDCSVKASKAQLERLARADDDSWAHPIRATLSWMRELKARGFRLGILTNMEAGYFERRVRRRFAEQIALADAVVVSGVEGVVKPAPAIYKLMERRLGLSPEEIVFVDDMPDNVSAARDLGWRSFRFASCAAARLECESIIQKANRSLWVPGRKRLKTLFYGVTHEHAYGKFESLKRLRDVYDIVAIVDDRAGKGARFLDERIDVDQAVRDGFRIVTPKEAMGLKDVDAVFVETANADLMKIADRFSRRGVPMHCDKPCGEAVEPYRTILERCRSKDIPLQIGYMYRGNPALIWIWKMVGEGRLGDIKFVEADMNHNYQHDGYDEYIGSFRGGILYNLGCHLVDLVYPLLGGAGLRTVTSMAEGTRGAAFLRFDNGMDVLLRTSDRMAGGILARRLRIDGTKGTVDLCPIERFDGRRLRVKIVVDGRVAWKDFGVQTDRYAGQLMEFAKIVLGEKPNDQDYARDLKVHELTLAACGLLDGKTVKPEERK